MSLRLAASVAVFLLIAMQGQAMAQPAASPPKLVQVSEQLPWFDQEGVSFGYSLAGTYLGLQGQQSYRGSAAVNVLGMVSNGSLELRASSTVTNTIFPNGTLYDDPFFPSYVQVLPLALVVPESFTVLAPTYGLTFKFLGNVTSNFQGTRVLAYAYSVSATSSGQGQSSLVKYFRVLPTNGVVLLEELTNTETQSTVNMTLTSLSRPTASSTAPLQFSSPDFAEPGSFIVYKNPGVGNQTIRYTTVFDEPSGLFAYERTVSANGTMVGVQFFVDQSSKPYFYPATTSFQTTISFPVAVGSLETGVLSFKGETQVDTPDGYFNTRSYANQTIRFEAYLDNSTGVAVYLELPGGVLELASSNFLTPTTPPAQSELALYLVPVAFVAFVCLLIFFHFRRTPRKPRRR